MIEDADLPIIQQMIDVSLAAYRQDPSSLVRRGTVKVFNANTQVATVLVDGDTAPIDMQSLLPVDLAPGQRVEVTFRPPHGVTVTGLVDQVAPAGVWITAKSENVSTELLPLDVWTLDLGDYTVPVAGGAMVLILCQSRTMTAGVQQIDIAVAGDLFPAPDGSTYSARSEGGTDFDRFNTSAQFVSILSAGQSWSPRAEFRVGSGGPNVFFAGWSALVVFWSPDRNIPL